MPISKTMDWAVTRLRQVFPDADCGVSYHYNPPGACTIILAELDFGGTEGVGAQRAITDYRMSQLRSEADANLLVAEDFTLLISDLLSITGRKHGPSSHH